jgi:hypothetical protein
MLIQYFFLARVRFSRVEWNKTRILVSSKNGGMMMDELSIEMRMKMLLSNVWAPS